MNGAKRDSFRLENNETGKPPPAVRLTAGGGALFPIAQAENEAGNFVAVDDVAAVCLVFENTEGTAADRRGDFSLAEPHQIAAPDGQADGNADIGKFFPGDVRLLS